MKEIKVRPTSIDFEHFSTGEVTAELHADIVCPNTVDLQQVKMGKTYKLVEDEPTNPPGFKGGKIPNQTIFKYEKPIYFDTDCPKDVLTRIIGAVDLAYNQPDRFVTSTLKGTLKQPVKRVMFNGNATILEIGDFKTVVKCDEGDEFNEVIGLGLALSRYYKKQPDTKKEIVLLEKMLKYNMVAEYCFQKYFKFDNKIMDNFVDKALSEKGKWVEL